MAYASWAHPNKTQGSGNDTVSWTGSEYTGRLARTTTATFSAVGCDNKTLIINQAGLPEFVTIQASASASKDGGGLGSITISGTSNSSKLTFSKTNDNIGISLESQYTVGGTSATSGTAISGDPGASQQFNYSIKLSNFQPNPGTTARTTQIVVTDNAGNTATCLVTQAAGEPYLTISPTTIELTAAGTAVSVAVTSNTNWTVA